MRPLHSWKYAGGTPKTITTSRDQKYTAVAGRGGIELFETGTGRLIHQWEISNEQILRIAFHPQRPVLYAIAGAQLHTFHFSGEIRNTITPALDKSNTPGWLFTLRDLNWPSATKRAAWSVTHSIPKDLCRDRLLSAIWDRGRILSLAYSQDGREICLSEGLNLVQCNSRTLEPTSYQKGFTTPRMRFTTTVRTLFPTSIQRHTDLP